MPCFCDRLSHLPRIKVKSSFSSNTFNTLMQMYHRKGQILLDKLAVLNSDTN